MKVKDIEWKELHYSENILYSYDFEGGRLTILDRETGWEFRSRDIETGYKDSQGKFWLASGGYDVRDYPEFTIQEAIAFVKHFANTCVGE